MAEPTYDPYAYSPLGKRIAGGGHAYRVEGDPNSGYLMNIFWFNPVTGEEGQTTEGWSRVPDEHKPYVYRDPGLRNEARSAFYQSGAAFGGTGGTGGFGNMGGGLLSGQAYAQQIAGGMPFKQVVAPGMSFSPDQPMGYIPSQPRPVVGQPAPTQEPSRLGEQLPPGADNGIDMSRFFGSREDQLKTLQSIFGPQVQYASDITGADLGLPMGEGTPMPAGTMMTAAALEELGITPQPRGAGLFGKGETIPAPSVMGSPLPLDIDIDELLKDIDVEQAIENLPTPLTQAPEVVAAQKARETERQAKQEADAIAKYGSVENMQNKIYEDMGIAQPSAPPVLPQIVPERQPVMPSIPVTPPVLEAPTPIVDVPINLGLPMIEDIAPVTIPEIPFQLPQIPQPVSIPTLPVVNTPVMPQPMVNLGMTPTNPVLNIDNIVSPIRQGSPRALLGTL